MKRFTEKQTSICVSYKVNSLHKCSKVSNLQHNEGVTRSFRAVCAKKIQQGTIKRQAQSFGCPDFEQSAWCHVTEWHPAVQMKSHSGTNAIKTVASSYWELAMTFFRSFP
jgi:hypothetical protein